MKREATLELILRCKVMKTRGNCKTVELNLIIGNLNRLYGNAREVLIDLENLKRQLPLMNDPKGSTLIVLAGYFLFIYIHTSNIHFFPLVLKI